MRAIIALIVAVAFGAVLGALIIRAQMNPKLVEITSQHAQLEQEKNRLTEELSFASERMQWVEKENASLRGQIQALSTGQMAPSGNPEEQIPNDSAAPEDSSAGGSASAYIPPDPSETEKPLSPQDQKLATAEQQMAYAERQLLDSVLVDDMEASTDPAEKARLQNVMDHRKLVRDLYRDLRDAATPEERQTVLDTILKARSNLKELVKNQQDEMMRQAIESADESTEEGKRALIDHLQEIQKSPYFTDPLFVWGMAAPDAAE